MSKVYVLKYYEYDTYSYSGISVREMYIHKSRQGAEAQATRLGLKIEEWCKNPDDCATIEEFTLLE